MPFMLVVLLVFDQWKFRGLFSVRSRQDDLIGVAKSNAGFILGISKYLNRRQPLFSAAPLDVNHDAHNHRHGVPPVLRSKRR